MSEENVQAANEGAEAGAEVQAQMAAAPAEAGADPEAAAAVDPEAAQGAGDTPTPEEARALFAERPDAAGCLTTEGWMRRDGTLLS